MKKMIILGFVSLLFVGCNNNAEDKTVTNKDTLAVPKSLAEVPGRPPLKIEGFFTGILPCKDCVSSKCLLQLTETTYTMTLLNTGSKSKAGLLTTNNGKCSQDSGLVTLMDKGEKPFQWYKIISKDSIEAILQGGKHFKSTKRYFLIRKEDKAPGH